MIMNFVPTLIYSALIDGCITPSLLFAISSSKFIVQKLSWTRVFLMDRIFYAYLYEDGIGPMGLWKATPDLLDSPSIIAEQIHYILLLITYGFTCPILAIAIGLAVIISTIVLRLVVGRHLQYLQRKNGDVDLAALAELENTIGKVWKIPHEIFGPVICFAFAFWALLFYDYVADSEVQGSSTALIVSAVVALISPFGVFLMIGLFKVVESRGVLALLYDRLNAAMRSFSTKKVRPAAYGEDVSFGMTPSMKEGLQQNPLHEDHIPSSIAINESL